MRNTMRRFFVALTTMIIALGGQTLRAQDGSLTIYVQHDSPGVDKEANWLPAPPKAEFGLIMRAYSPRPEIASGEWVSPPVTRPI
jgi:hypothetical protein